MANTEPHHHMFASLTRVCANSLLSHGNCHTMEADRSIVYGRTSLYTDVLIFTQVCQPDQAPVTEPELLFV